MILNGAMCVIGKFKLSWPAEHLLYLVAGLHPLCHFHAHNIAISPIFQFKHTYCSLKALHSYKNTAPANEQIAHIIAEKRSPFQNVARGRDYKDAAERSTPGSTEQLQRANQDLQRKLKDLREQQTTELQKNQKANQELQTQLDVLRTKHVAELKHNKQEQQALQKQLEESMNLLEAALENHRRSAADNQLRQQEIQQKYLLLQSQYAATEEQIRQTTAATHAQIEELQQNNKLLQDQYTTKVQQHQQIFEQERRKFQAQSELLQAHLRHRSEVATVTGKQVNWLRNLLFEIRQDTVTHIQAFQEEIKYYKTKLHKLAAQLQDHPDRIKELAKIEAFDLWMQGHPETNTQLSAESLLHRVTTKLNHTLRNLKTELYQATQERDELQNQIEQRE